jgi:hypothetical protein
VSAEEIKGRRPPPSAPIVPAIDPELLKRASERSAAGLGLEVAAPAGEANDPPPAVAPRPPAHQAAGPRRVRRAMRFVKADVGPDVLRALAVQALLEGRQERELVSEALRAYLIARGQKL